MESRCKSSFKEMFPYGQELIHLVPSEGAKPPRRSLLMSQNDTPTTGESEDHSCHRVVYQLSTSGRVLSSTKVELHELPRRARPYGHKNRYLRSLDWILKGGRPVPPPNFLEERNQSVPRKDSQPFKDLGKNKPRC